MKIQVTFDAEVPDGTQHEHITEWLLFELGEVHQMGKNPLLMDIEAENVDWKEKPTY